MSFVDTLVLPLLIRYRTTSRVSPPTLVPARADGQYLKTKLVDFGIILKPSRVTDTGFKNLDPLPQASAASYNQTTDNTLLDRPLAVNIETEEVGGDFNEALMQLSIWSSAQYARLRLLAQSTGQENVTMPVLPAIIVQGPIWTLCATSHNDNQTASFRLFLLHLAYVR